MREGLKIVILNTALQGQKGNTAQLLKIVRHHLCKAARVTLLTLAENPKPERIWSVLQEADGIVLGTGTHWDSWSSHCQSFLEVATPTEGTKLWLGKPVAVVVTEHSVGGKGVLSRLQGVLSSYGCLIPPMSGLVYSLAAQEMIRHQPKRSQDLWCIADLKVVADNLLLAARHRELFPWSAWSVDRRSFEKRWVKPSAVAHSLLFPVDR